MFSRRHLKVRNCYLAVFLVIIGWIFLFDNFHIKDEMEDYKLPRKGLLSIKNRKKLNNFVYSSETDVRKKYVTKSMVELGKMDEINKYFLFLNSIPQSGSEILVFLLEKLQGFNSFKHIRLKTNAKDTENLSKIQQASIVNHIYDTRREKPIPLSFDKKIKFINFTSFDRQSPTYVNIIRHPVAKLITKIISSSKNKVIYDDFTTCMLENEKKCLLGAEEYLSQLTIPYFCGHNPRCMLLNNEWAFRTAKKNVEKYYAVVGILEHLNATFNVLENKIPHFFQGSQEIYNKHLLDIYNHKKNQKLSPNLHLILEKKLTKEMEFYMWIKQKLFQQMSVV